MFIFGQMIFLISDKTVLWMQSERNLTGIAEIEMNISTATSHEAVCFADPYNLPFHPYKSNLAGGFHFQTLDLT